MREIKMDGNYSYLFSPYERPIAKVAPGEVVKVYTEDAFNGELTSEDQVPVTPTKPYNPATGPIYIEGAEPGDTLAVKIIDIEMDRDWAVSAILDRFGGLVGTRITRMLNEPFPESVYIYKYEDGMFRNNNRLTFPWEPFLGTLATAPAMEAISTLAPFNSGGNMDVPDTKPGNTVYLPVNTPGALFYVGDVHAKQGQGELCGIALEISAKVTLSFELVKAKSIDWPRIESDTELMVVGSARPMEDAARIAYCELIVWMEELGWDTAEAYQALSQAGKLYVCNMVDTQYSLVAKVDKELAYRK